jgi:hypothetical protein
MKQIEFNKQIQLSQVTASAPRLLCQYCGGVMRLIGSESHPVEANTDLLTYSCAACEEFFVQSIESQSGTPV